MGRSKRRLKRGFQGQRLLVDPIIDEIQQTLPPNTVVAHDAVITIPKELPILGYVEGKRVVVGVARMSENGHILGVFDNPQVLNAFKIDTTQLSLATATTPPGQNTVCWQCAGDRCEKVENDKINCVCCVNGHVV